MDLDLPGSVAYAGPELVLGAAAFAVAALSRVKRLDQRGLGEIAILAAAVSVLMAARLSGWGEVWVLDRLFVIDGPAIFAKVSTGLATVAVLWIWLESTTGSREGEVGALVLLVALTLDLVASAAHLASVVMSIELASLALWALCRSPAKSAPLRQRAAARVVSLITVAAAAWLAGYAGSGDAELVRGVVFGFDGELPPAATASVLVLVGALPARVFVATSARIAHVRLPLAAFLSVAFATTGVVLAARWIFAVFSRPGLAALWVSPEGVDWTFWLGAAALGALLLGCLTALREAALSRLLGAGAIAQLGFALLGGAAASDAGLRAMLHQLAVSSLALLGAFHAAALVLRGADRDAIDGCRGLLGEARSFAAFALAVFLLSLAGVPPLAGFFARVQVVRALLDAGKISLAAAALAASVAMLVAYGRVLRALYAPAVRAIPTVRAYDLLLTGLLAASVVTLGVVPGPLRAVVSRSVHFLPR